MSNSNSGFISKSDGNRCLIGSFQLVMYLNNFCQLQHFLFYAIISNPTHKQYHQSNYVQWVNSLIVLLLSSIIQCLTDLTQFHNRTLTTMLIVIPNITVPILHFLLQPPRPSISGSLRVPSGPLRSQSSTDTTSPIRHQVAAPPWDSGTSSIRCLVNQSGFV